MGDEEHEDVVEERAMGVTRYLFSLPNSRRTIVYLFAVSFLAGIGVSALYNPHSSLAESFVYGGPEGVLLIGVPALLSAVLASSVLGRKKFRTALKYFSFIALGGAVTVAILYAISLLLPTSLHIPQWAFVILANMVVFIIWVVSGAVPLNYGRKAIAIALIHPSLNLAFLVIWKAYGVLEGGSVPLLALRFLVGSGILLLALWSLYYIINAPAKRNFGVNAVQAVALFFAQALQGSRDFEHILEGMGEEVETLLGAVVFRRKGSKKFKAIFAVPYVHYGPFGNLGGSEFPSILNRQLSKTFGCPAIPFHATAFHDFNPVHAKSIEPILEAYKGSIADLKGYSDRGAFLTAKAGRGDVFALQFGKSAFLALTRAPHCTEDVEFSAGFALRNLAKSQGFQEVVIVDKHNSYRPGKMMFYVGSPEFSDYNDSVAQLSPSRALKPLRLGVYHDPFTDMHASDGVGSAGMHVVAIESGGKRACFVIFDANNAIPEFRQKVIDSILPLGFDYCDVFTTDTHAVNNVNGIENPLGGHSNRERIIARAVKGARHALEDVEPVEVGGLMQRHKIQVMGAGRSGELLTTVNAIISITKILAPIVLAAALGLALLSIIFLARVVPAI